MGREAAARLLGVGVDAPRAQVEAAYRAKVRSHHPDSFPTGSAQWQSATLVMHALNDARQALIAPAALSRPTPAPAHPSPAPRPAPAPRPTARRPPPAPAPTAPRQPPTPPSSAIANDDHAVRRRGLRWGAGLLLAALVAALAGAGPAGSDLAAVWSPCLALVGLVNLVIAWRADRRIQADEADLGPKGQR